MSPQPQAAVGAPLSRVDGRLKVTGQAKYAADHEPSGPEGVVHAVVVDSSVARGRITGIDTGAAEAQPGVLKVLHHRNAPRLPYGPNPGSLNLPGERLRVFQDDQVRFHGQPVAVVVATTLEAAQHAASLVEIDYSVRAVHDRPERGAGDGRARHLYARRRGGRSAIRRRSAGDDVPARPQPPQRDGTPCHRRPVGRRPAHPVGQDPVGAEPASRGRRQFRYTRGVRPRHLALRRRCVRKRGTGLAAHHHRGPRRPRGGAPGQARTDAQAALLRGRIPAGVRVQGAAGQRPPRAADRHDPRPARRDLPLREVLGTRRPLPRADALHHPQRRPDAPDRAAGREHPDPDARPRLLHRRLPHRERDGRTRPRARHRPHRTAPAQRTRERPGQWAAVLHPTAARVLHRRRPRVRLEPPRPPAPLHPRRRLADRHRHGDRAVRHPARPGPGLGAAGRRRHRPDRVLDQ